MQIHKDTSGDDVRASVAMAKSRGRDAVRSTKQGKVKVVPFAASAAADATTTGAHIGPGTYAVEHYDPFARAPAFDFERLTGRPEAVGPHGERPTGLTDLGAWLAREPSRDLLLPYTQYVPLLLRVPVGGR